MSFFSSCLKLSLTYKIKFTDWFFEDEWPKKGACRSMTIKF